MKNTLKKLITRCWFAETADGDIDRDNCQVTTTYYTKEGIPERSVYILDDEAVETFFDPEGRIRREVFSDRTVIHTYSGRENGIIVDTITTEYAGGEKSTDIIEKTQNGTLVHSRLELDGCIQDTRYILDEKERITEVIDSDGNGKETGHQYVKHDTAADGTDIAESKLFGEDGRLILHDVQKTVETEDTSVCETRTIGENGDVESVETTTEKWIVDGQGEKHLTSEITTRDGKPSYEFFYEYPYGDFNAEKEIYRNYDADFRTETENIPEYWND